MSHHFLRFLLVHCKSSPFYFLIFEIKKGTMKNLKTALLCIITLLSLFSCKKDEPAPVQNIETNTTRILGEWVIFETYTNGTLDLSDPNNQDLTWIFKEENELLITGNLEGISYTIKQKWWFENNESNLTIAFNIEDEVELLNTKILKLTNDDLWIENTTDEGYIIEIRYRKKSS